MINRWNYTFKHKAFPDYFQSLGLGFYEYFLLSEDIGAEPLPVISCGLSCQYESNEVVPLDELDPYVQDALDLREFANGDVSTTWGKVRAEMGHPEPFNLKMIAVGNEQWDKVYVERLEVFTKAIREKYPNIKFVKLFDSDMGKAKKIIRKLSKLGYQAAIYDTLKVEDSFDRSTWEQLLIQSRQLFQLASKENIALITTFQLALSTLNKRWLDAGCLSNGKQVKEVYSEMIYLRQIWDDEYTGEKHDCKAYRLKRDANGKLTKVKEMITLDKDKKYLVAFLDKTRNDEDKQTILYEWNGRFNKWTEIGYCTIYNDHAA